VSGDVDRAGARNPAWLQTIEQAAERSFHRLERIISRIAQRRFLSVLLVGVLSFVLSAAFSLLVRWPQPGLHDEFSVLLAADTFAHGRLTNPTHPLWVHFESMHIIHQPSYASKYPPGQGLFLAAGQVLTGYPITGVWLSTAMACAAICWMLFAWMPPRWALIGGMLAVVHPIIFKWSQTYWGGSVPLLGGALLVGSARRLVKGPSARDSLLLAAGLVVLANSRPYEGLVLSVLVVLPLLIWMVSRSGPARSVSCTKIILPSFILLTVSAGLMGLYNFRVTGSAFRLPYMVHEATYGVAPLFLWQQPRPVPSYNHSEIQKFHQWTLDELDKWNSRIYSTLASRLLVANLRFFNAFFVFFFIQISTFLLLIRNKWMLMIVLGWEALCVALVCETWDQPHYFAPALGLVFLWELQGLRLFQTLRRRRSFTGRSLTRAFLVVSVLWLIPSANVLLQLDREDKTPQIFQRAAILKRLESEEGSHLVVVRYGPHHNVGKEWVYNGADIDAAKVVWAREMGRPRDRELLNYYHNRKIWLLEADECPPRLKPYDKAMSQ
jgi:hypothetical protein